MELWGGEAKQVALVPANETGLISSVQWDSRVTETA